MPAPRRPVTFRPLPRVFRKFVGSLAVWCLVGAAALGQEPASAPSQPAAPPSGGTTVVVSGRSLYVEGGLVLVLFGAALFAVCRSSRRN